MKLRPKQQCLFDLVSLGEVMLRLDPGDMRVRTARSFNAWEGGGEYNVARGLRKCFGLNTAVVTALVDNDVGRLIEDMILQGGVDTRLIRWVPFDGIGRAARNGINFTERGFGVRGALGISDRAHTAASQLQPGDIDWEHIFGELGVRWFHTGGIFAALSANTADVVLEAVAAAKRHGTVCSYDLNYRPSLWRDFGGKGRAREVNRQIAPYIDVLLGNEEDFEACLGLSLPGAVDGYSRLDAEDYSAMMFEAVKEYPNFQFIASTLRTVTSASRNDWTAMCFTDGRSYHTCKYSDLEIYDRVGGGDSFASGFIYGLLETGDPQRSLDYGAAHGALAMTTPGDTSMANKKEVEALMLGGSARVYR